MPKIEKSPDGKTKVELESGPEVFTADDPMQMTEKLAKSFDDNKRYYKAEISRRDAELEALRQQVQQQQQPIQQTQTPQNEELLRTADWMWDTMALKLGPQVKGSDLLGTLVQNDASLKQWNIDKVALSFKQKCKDFSDTDENIDLVMSRAAEDFGLNNVEAFEAFSQNNPVAAANCLIAAHRACVADGVYKALTPEEQRLALGDQNAIQQQKNPTAPPMLSTGNPEMQLNQADPYSMKMDELRRMAIQQQLGGNK